MTDDDLDPSVVELRLAAVAYAEARAAWLADAAAASSVLEAERRLHEAAVRFTLPGSDPALLLAAGMNDAERDRWFDRATRAALSLGEGET
jgi:hypothetical protein